MALIEMIKETQQSFYYRCINPLCMRSIVVTKYLLNIRVS